VSLQYWSGSRPIEAEGGCETRVRRDEGSAVAMPNPSRLTGRARACALAAALAAPGAGAALAQDGIGVTATVVRDVSGNAGGRNRALSVGDGVFRDETITTGARSNTQVLFLDETSLTIGPASSVMLDRFVYAGGGRASEVSVEIARGALRFVSGSSRPQSYTIKTPVATIGVRGTILDIFVRAGTVVVLLEEGASDVCSRQGCIGLARAGTYLMIHPGGRIDGPKRWDGSLRRIIGPVSFPLYGWHLQLDDLPRYDVQDPARDNVDQINRRDQINSYEAPQPEPTPVPVPEPDPTPEPIPTPTPEPTPEPAPTPAPVLDLEPVPTPTPEPEPTPNTPTTPETPTTPGTEPPPPTTEPPDTGSSIGT
jgi:hypothetical protein